MSKELYIIKGTGLALDGQLVIVKGIVQFPNDNGGDEFALVAPPNSRSDTQNTLVKLACLQPMGNTDRYEYSISIVKRGPNGMEDVGTVLIKDAIRNVPVMTIKEYLETNLTPILRMD